MNLRPFKLYRVYLDPLYLLNVSHFSLELNSYGLYPGSKRKVRPRMFTSSIKRLFTFTLSRTVDVKGIYSKGVVRAELLFCS